MKAPTRAFQAIQERVDDTRMIVWFMGIETERDVEFDGYMQLPGDAVKEISWLSTNAMGIIL